MDKEDLGKSIIEDTKMTKVMMGVVFSLWLFTLGCVWLDSASDDQQLTEINQVYCIGGRLYEQKYKGDAPVEIGKCDPRR